jgi:hypothetical protein
MATIEWCSCSYRPSKTPEFLGLALHVKENILSLASPSFIGNNITIIAGIWGYNKNVFTNCNKKRPRL